MKPEEVKKGDKDMIINALIKMRVEKFASKKTMLEFLMGQLKYGQTFAYELINEANQKIVEMFKEEHEQSFANAVARLEEIIETTTDRKMRMEAIREMNKLLGIARPQRIDVTTNGKDLNTISIEIVTPKKDDDNEKEA